MLQTRSAGQQVVGDVQHVVRVVVGQMDFQQAEALIDCPIEAQRSHQQVHGSDAAVGGGPRAVGKFVMDVRGGHHGPVASPVVSFVQSSGDPPLGLSQPFRYTAFHSKSSLLRGLGCLNAPIISAKTRAVSSFFMQSA